MPTIPFFLTTLHGNPLIIAIRINSDGSLIELGEPHEIMMARAESPEDDMLFMFGISVDGNPSTASAWNRIE